ncbi:MAG: alpha/beta hydrolase [Anaerolineae bacterium]|nr:alpha/beta hydrolase [Anaerolineae bacterium]NUQ05303.1 alpha/beta hydrolase [Anaerolineae bacterium]
MATLTTEQGIVHYEAYGRGRPVLLLHGWLNSWALWRNSIELLGRNFRTYALDFFGFGDSDARTEDFSVANFGSMVNQFMDRMGIVKAPLIGHSMGGTVALSVSMRYPEKVVKVGVVGSPIQGSSLRPLLRVAAYRGWAELAEASPVLYDLFQKGFTPFLRGYSHFLARDGRALGDMLSADAAKLAFGPFWESINTLRNTDLTPHLSQVNVPVLAVYGKRDNIVDPRQHKIIKTHIPHSRIAWFENSGHFPMLDEPERFHNTLLDFLHNG